MAMTAIRQEPIKISGDMVIISQEDYSELLNAWNNLSYLKKLNHSIEQANQGKVVVKSMEELEAIANG